MKISACLVALIYFALGQVSFADEFQKVKCGTDIPKAMIGQHSQNERVAVTEKKYRALGLKHLGADEISDRLSSINWLICGTEFIALVDKSGLVSDVLPHPPHSKKSPAFEGICQVKGKDLPDIVFAILDGAQARDPAEDSLPAVTAWKIDQEAAKFVKISTQGMLCPRSGVYTVDGGQ